MMDKKLQNEIDEIFREYDAADTPGCALGIVQDGALVYSRGYGMAHLETHTPITADTMFHLASVSKQFTAACIALLEEAGELSLQDPVTKYIAFLPQAARNLNVGQLVYMTNGLEDFYDVSSFIMGLPEGNYFSAQEAIRILQAANWLKFPPGEQWSYGNSGYFLLGLIVERISGQPFDVFVRQQIFEPLEMRQTYVRTDRFMDIPLRAQGYARFPKKDGQDTTKYTFQPQNELIEFGGAGQVWSCMNDLVKWERNFFDNRLGGKGSRLIEKMSQSGRLNDGTPTRYGYGQFIGQRNGLKVIFHEGGAAGVNTVIYRLPEKKLSIICLSNLGDFLTAQLKKLGEECYERVAGLVSPWEAEPVKLAAEPGRKQPEPEPMPEIPLAVLESLTGNYEDPVSSHIWEVNRDGESLQVLENYAGPFQLRLEDFLGNQQIAFRSAGSEVSGFFDRSSEGACTKIYTHQGEAVRVFQRFLSGPLAPDCLSEYEAVYTCAPLGVSYRVHAAIDGIRLENLNPEYNLLNVVFTPTITDMFLARYPPLIGWYVLQFKREAGGKIISFSFRDEMPGREKWVFEKEG